MNWLIWKDFRLNRPIVICVVLFFLVINVGAIITVLCWGKGTTDELLGALQFAPFSALMLSQLCIAALGGNIIAGERGDRSAEFISYLPVSRGRILLSKIVVAIAIVVLVWAPNLLVFAVANYLSKESGILSSEHAQEFWYIIGIYAVTGLSLFSAAWLLSSLLRSAVFATFGGLITPASIAMAIAWVAHLCELSDETCLVVYCWIALPLAAASFIAGTWYYLRRVEP
jgi:ABC-type transport system involved in multi-copper enzyme maturation permease subunit